MQFASKTKLKKMKNSNKCSNLKSQQLVPTFHEFFSTFSLVFGNLKRLAVWRSCSYCRNANVTPAWKTLEIL